MGCGNTALPLVDGEGGIHKDEKKRETNNLVLMTLHDKKLDFDANISYKNVK